MNRQSGRLIKNDILDVVQVLLCETTLCCFIGLICRYKVNPRDPYFSAYFSLKSEKFKQRLTILTDNDRRGADGNATG